MLSGFMLPEKTDLFSQVVKFAQTYLVDEEKRDDGRREAEASLYEYVLQAWPHIESVPFVENWHIRALCDHLQAVSEKKIKNLLINIPPACSKPVFEEEWLSERSRGRVMLRDIRVGDEVLTHRGRFRRVLAVHEQGVLPLLKVATHTGRSVRCAADHPFLTPRGWVQAKDLHDGDVLACVHSAEASGTETVTPEEARLLGYLIGDGCCKYQQATFTNEDEAVLEDFEQCAKACGFRTWRKVKAGCKTFTVILCPVYRDGQKKWTVKRHGPHPVWSFVERHGLKGADSYSKRVPASILAASNRLIAEFVGAYWSCDGFVAKRGGSRTDCVIGADTVSEGLARDVQHLLTRLGIMSRIRRKQSKIQSKRQGSLYVSWSVVCSTLDHGSRFAACVPIRHSGKSAGLSRYTRSGFDRILNEDHLVDVLDAGEGPCRCLTVEEDQSFAVNDLAVHNSLLCCVFWPTWQWLRKPSSRWFFASYDQRLSTRDSVKCRALINSQWYQSRWGNRFRFTGDQNLKTYYENDRGGYRLATSVGGHGTGEHPDFLVFDDINDVNSAESDKERQTVLDWWDLTMPARGVSRNASRVIIQQRLHSEDLSGHVLKEVGWVHICLPMRFEKDRMEPTPLVWIDPRTVEGELLSPKYLDEDKVAGLEKRLGYYGSAGQLQQRPVPREGGMFKLEWFKEIIDAPPAAASRVRSWDRAATQDGGCWTCGVLIGRTSDARYFIEDVVRGQWDTRRRDDVIKLTAERDRAKYPKRPPLIVVEREPGSSGKDSVLATAILLEGFAVVSEAPTGKKDVRAEPFASQCGAGNVALVRGPWNDAYIEEMCSFPKGAMDQVDATSGGFNKLLKMHQGSQIHGAIVTSANMSDDTSERETYKYGDQEIVYDDAEEARNWWK